MNNFHVGPAFAVNVGDWGLDCYMEYKEMIVGLDEWFETKLKLFNLRETKS